MTDPKDPYAAPDPNEPPPPPASDGYGTPPPPPGYGPPPPAYGAAPPGQPYGTPAQAGYNTLAIVGFIASFLCGPAGIVMGFIARNQIKQRGEKGDGLAIAAIVIGILGMVLNFLYLSSQ